MELTRGSMTYEELVNAAKLRARKTKSNVLDEDIKLLIDFVLEDLQRIGVTQSRIEAMDDPILINAVLAYVRAYTPVDSNHEKWMKTYDSILTKIKGSKKYTTEVGEGSNG